MVDLKWPTCISFATLGEEKSTKTVFTGSRGAQLSIPSINSLSNLSAIHFFDKTIFTNPGPATEHDSIISDCGRFLTIACPTAGGPLNPDCFPFIFANIPIALLHW
ncbi:hypothetical protein V8G54_011820 [Vigna mungo]|uniref:Uncharacterized protein n=1 Tax=Vigna mungo TaxID=3915 RepID=A0AAQ3S3E6_VIGMU